MNTQTKLKMKIAPIVLGIFLIFLAFLIMSNVVSNPAYGNDPYVCHSQGGYMIESENSQNLFIENGDTINIIISGSGTDVQIHVVPGARDNDLFTITPSNQVSDNSEHDSNPSSNEISVNFEITAPEEDGTYLLMVLARSPNNDTPELAYIEFEIDVGPGATIPQKIWNFIQDNILNHMNIYIGGTAIFCLALGTLLYEIDDQKFTKTHGILATTSFILTTINVIFILQTALPTLGNYIQNPPQIDPGQLIHMILGTIGYIAGVIAVITGISGIRTKKPGYIALIFWTINFIYGISPLGWGIGI